MKTFDPKGQIYNGALQFIYHHSSVSNIYPKFATNGIKEEKYNYDDLIHLITKAGEAKVFYGANGIDDFTYIHIDIGTYRMTATHFQVGGALTGSPPTIFQLAGSRDNILWINLTDMIEKTDLCPPTPSQKCNEVNQSTFQVSQVSNIQYFKFIVYQMRYQLSSSQASPDIRISGFELYGNLYSEANESYSYAFLKELLIIFILSDLS